MNKYSNGLVLLAIILIVSCRSSTISHAPTISPKSTPKSTPEALKLSKDHFVGFQNCGATCYMNSVLQSLLHTRHLADFFLNQKIKIRDDAENKGDLTKSFQALFKKYYSHENKKNFKPIDFTAALKSHPKFSDFNPSSQEDPEEFIDKFFEALSNDIKSEYKTSQTHSYSQAFNDFLTQYYTKEKFSVLNKLFDYTTVDRIECFNKGNSVYLSETYNAPTNRLQLPFSEKGSFGVPQDTNREFSLTKMIDSYIETEFLQGSNVLDFKCGASKSGPSILKDQVSKQTNFQTVPGFGDLGYFIIQVKRMGLDLKTFKTKKISNPLSFPLEFEITPSKASNPVKFRLYALVNHYGASLKKGHYKSVVKDFNENKWYELNDALVIPKNQNQVSEDYKENAYLLFYERVEK